MRAKRGPLNTNRELAEKADGKMGAGGNFAVNRTNVHYGRLVRAGYLLMPPTYQRLTNLNARPATRYATQANRNTRAAMAALGCRGTPLS
jgi:hypothetical protein